MTVRRDEPLTVRLSAALGEFLRREAERRSIEPEELVRLLLMRGLHAQRLDDVIRDLCPDCGTTPPSSEAMLAARLEAGAVLGAFAAMPQAQPDASQAEVGKAMRAAIDRARDRRRAGRREP